MLTAPLLCFVSALMSPAAVASSVPKPLIPVDGRPLISHWLELLLEAGIPREDVLVVTNQHFYPAFKKWAEDNKVRPKSTATTPVDRAYPSLVSHAASRCCVRFSCL
jgi:2-C-methyl-D-erythritol 4-phosphate cytidylyltransferase